MSLFCKSVDRFRKDAQAVKTVPADWLITAGRRHVNNRRLLARRPTVVRWLPNNGLPIIRHLIKTAQRKVRPVRTSQSLRSEERSNSPHLARISRFRDTDDCFWDNCGVAAKGRAESAHPFITVGIVCQSLFSERLLELAFHQSVRVCRLVLGASFCDGFLIRKEFDAVELSS